jgi:hypothetical protein
VGLLVGRKGVKSGTILERCILVSCSDLSVLRHFVSVAAYLENAVLHRYVKVYGSSVFTATLEVRVSL